MRLDHLVITAPDLAGGRAWAEERLGRPPGGGGAHPGMGTHNALWSLGDVYLEVIALDPAARSTAGPRWFGLDRPVAAPGLVTWAVATEDLEGFTARAPVAMRPVTTARRGDLAWEVALAEGAGLPLDGQWPLGLRWPPGRHPTAVLEDGGLRLGRLEIAGPEADRVAAALALSDPRVAFRRAETPAVAAWLTRADGTEIAL